MRIFLSLAMLFVFTLAGCGDAPMEPEAAVESSEEMTAEEVATEEALTEDTGETAEEAP